MVSSQSIGSKGNGKPDIVPMEIDMLEDVFRIECASFSDPWKRWEWQDVLNNPHTSSFVLMMDGKILGFVGLYNDQGIGHTMNFAVDPACRGQGYGSALLQRVLTEARQMGFGIVMLEVRRSNMAAISLYERFGLCEVGVRPDYYAEPKEDALVYFLQL